MKIKRLTAENIKRIRVVDITPDGSVVQVTGDNGAGKTSALDCIPFALGGKKALDPEPLRLGAEDGFIDLDLGDYVVRRNFKRTAEGETLSDVTVLSRDGALYPTPQRLLDGLYGKLTFDPAAFDRMTPADKLTVLKKLVDLGIDLDLLDGQNRADKETRTAINRDLKSAEERVKTLAAGIIPDMDVTLIDTAPLFAKTAEASAHNTAVAERRRMIVHRNEQSEELAAKAAKRREQAAQMIVEAEEMEATSREIVRALAALPVEAEMIDVVDINEQIKAAQLDNARKNDQARQRALRDAAVIERDAIAAKSDTLTERMNERTRMKEAAIAGAKMPVDGLSFGDAGVLLHGVPFEQASAAERLRTSFAMAVAMNPTLKIALIRDGSLLSDKSLALIAEMAEANDFQVWVEQVDTSGDVGFVMVDGTLESSPASRAAEKV